MARVHFVPADKTVEVENGTTILKAAKQAGVMVESPCNAMGTCGKCRVRLPGAADRAAVRQSESRHHLSDEEKAEGWVLACQTEVWGDLTV